MGQNQGLVRDVVMAKWAFIIMMFLGACSRQDFPSTKAVSANCLAYIDAVCLDVTIGNFTTTITRHADGLEPNPIMISGYVPSEPTQAFEVMVEEYSEGSEYYLTDFKKCSEERTCPRPQYSKLVHLYKYITADSKHPETLRGLRITVFRNSTNLANIEQKIAYPCALGVKSGKICGPKLPACHVDPYTARCTW